MVLGIKGTREVSDTEGGGPLCHGEGACLARVLVLKTALGRNYCHCHVRVKR